MARSRFRILEFVAEASRAGQAVHIDANPVVAYKSSQYVQELVGLVVGQGFRALIKPESWAASDAADHVVRSQGKLPRNRMGALAHLTSASTARPFDRFWKECEWRAATSEAW